ncbi:MAG TPA: helix-turn-helix transcriptional regulator [Streptosporangiaceae bacterium]|nr:helix-turn-helix transcriptional regulator [Streptosporangiaceae bacterium]
MTTSQAQQAREALGGRLRDIRLEAGLNARALARLAGWHNTKVSKLEHGTRPPSRDDIRTWCELCGADDQQAELLATARNIDAMYVEWRRQMRAGMKHFQGGYAPLYERTHLFRVYETTVLPGLLTTPAYSAAVLRFFIEFLELDSDLDEAVAARVERQKILYRANRKLMFVIEEQTLRTRVGDAAVMAEQLGQLLVLMSLPAVSLGIIPATAERHSLTQGPFWIFGQSRVQVETVSAGLDITQPGEVALYIRVFEHLQRSASYGRDARALIQRALNEFHS